jgi:hypothetical protein
LACRWGNAEALDLPKATVRLRKKIRPADRPPDLCSGHPARAGAFNWRGTRT